MFKSNMCNDVWIYRWCNVCQCKKIELASSSSRQGYCMNHEKHESILIIPSYG